MNTKKCSRCGWLFSTNDPARFCAICGAEFPGYKVEVPKRVPLPHGRVLSVRRPPEPTSTVRTLKRYYREVARTDQQYADWLDRIKLIQKPYTTLTEAQWLEACRYFGGCALCDSLDIETRGFFIPFSDGGMYCNWNVIPLCDKCATMTITQKNPFRRMHGELNRSLEVRRGLGLKKVQAVADYLNERIDEAIG